MTDGVCSLRRHVAPTTFCACHKARESYMFAVSDQPPEHSSRQGEMAIGLVLEPTRRIANVQPILLEHGVWTIGSSDECAIRLTVPGIHARHAIISVERNQISLEALDSRTWHNDGPFRKVALQIEDRIAIGPVEFRVRAAKPDEIRTHTRTQPSVPSHRATSTTAEDTPKQSDSIGSGNTSSLLNLEADRLARLRAELERKADVLASREHELIAEERSFHEEISQQRAALESEEASIRKTKAELARQEESLARQSRMLQSRTEQFEQSTTSREAEIATVQEELAAARQTLANEREQFVNENKTANELLAEERAKLDQEQQLIRTERADLRDREIKLNQQADELSQRDRELNSTQEQLDHQSLEIQQREVAIADAAAEQERRHQELLTKESEYESRKSELAQQQHALEQRTATLNEQESDLGNKSRETQRKLQDVERHHLLLSEFKDELNAASAQLLDHQRKLNRREQETDKQSSEIRQKTQELAQLREQLESERSELDAERVELTDAAKRIDERLEAVCQAEATIADQEDGLRAREENLAQKEQELADHEQAYQSRLEQLKADETQLAEQFQSYEAQSHDLNELRSELESQRDTLDKERSELQAEHDNLTKQRAELEERLNTLDNHAEEIEREKESLAQQREEFDSHKDSLYGQTESLKADFEELATQRAEFKTQVAEIEELRLQLDNKKQKLDELQQELDSERAELDDRAQQLESSIESLANERKEFELRQNELETTACDDLAELQSKHRDLQTALDQQHEVCQKLEADVERLQAELKDRDSQVAELREQLAEANERLDQTNDSDKIATEDVSRLEDDLATRSQELEECQAKLADALAELEDSQNVVVSQSEKLEELQHLLAEPTTPHPIDEDVDQKLALLNQAEELKVAYEELAAHQSLLADQEQQLNEQFERLALRESEVDQLLSSLADASNTHGDEGVASAEAYRPSTDDKPDGSQTSIAPSHQSDLTSEWQELEIERDRLQREKQELDELRAKLENQVTEPTETQAFDVDQTLANLNLPDVFEQPLNDTSESTQAEQIELCSIDSDPEEVDGDDLISEALARLGVTSDDKPVDSASDKSNEETLPPKTTSSMHSELAAMFGIDPAAKSEASDNDTAADPFDIFATAEQSENDTPVAQDTHNVEEEEVKPETPSDVNPANQNQEEIDVDDPDSIALYMERLLARNRRPGSGTPSNTGPSQPVQKPAATSVKKQPENEVPAVVVEESKPVEPRAPRKKIDKEAERAGLATMRELANFTAQSAVARHSWNKLRNAVVLKIGLATTCFATAGVLVAYELPYSMFFAPVAALSGAYLCYDLINSVRELKRMPKSKKRKNNVEE